MAHERHADPFWRECYAAALNGLVARSDAAVVLDIAGVVAEAAHIADAARDHVKGEPREREPVKAPEPRRYPPSEVGRIKVEGP